MRNRTDEINVRVFKTEKNTIRRKAKKCGMNITNVAADSYTLDWSVKTITITAYAETKEESMLINRYIENSPLKFKRVIQKG